MADDAGDVRLVLLASPLLGPATWAPVAHELVSRGRDVLLPPPYDAVAAPEDVLAHVLRRIPRDQPVVLVPHSNAGLYAAAIAAVRDLRGIVFVDARLPPDEVEVPAREPAFRAFLGGLADGDGLLPGWTHWWPEEEVRGLFPDADTRAAVEAEQPRLPLAYFDAPVPAPEAWRRLPAAYLAFGDTYADELGRAERAGWPVERLEGRHLHPLVDPTGVASALERLLGRLRLRGA